MTFDADLETAHRRSSNHRAEVLSSESCGCFYCCSVFHPTEIEDWVDEDRAGAGQTALCPRCGIDSVIGSNAGIPLTQEFLSRTKAYWF
ncbi:MAG TPA: hypothetical protein VLS93_08110 [Anaeromyxobacteraceae bacterium]|nr:hypothetical protein [Anaeromyxobacteraceae bacterium]